MRHHVLLVLLTVVACAEAPPSPTGGGANLGGGSATGGGGGALDAGRPEGATCASTADCGAALTCTLQVTGSGSANRCAACASGGQACRDGGVCITVVQSSGTSLVCTEGGPGEPCSAGTQCRSGQCDTVVTAGGTTQRCL